jgi:hypothetical protein
LQANRWISLPLFAVTATISITLFDSLLPRLAICSLLAGLTGAVVLRGERKRDAALVIASLAAAVLGLAAVANWLAPTSKAALVRNAVPATWIEHDTVMGYRLVPSTTVSMSGTFRTQLVYRVTYTIGSDGNRVTPAGPDGADTYVFIGDSFVFGEGVSDKDTLAAQFAEAMKFHVVTANLAVPGYGPNHWLRAFETDRLESFKTKRVKAVIAWIIPDHLNRVIGEAPWLADGPAYLVGKSDLLEFAGTFSEVRGRHPIDGAAYWLRQRVDFLKLVGERGRQAESTDLFVAIMTHIREEVNQQFGARLIVLYSWPDGYSVGHSADPFLVQTLNRLRQQDIELVSVNELMIGLNPKDVQIPYDGHPTATVNRLAAQALKRRLLPNSKDD